MKKFLKVAFFTICILFIHATTLLSQDSGFFLHTVTKGQGLLAISKMYGVTEASIIKLNPGSELMLREGQSLKIPQQRKSNQEDIFHTIKEGETLYSLSVENRVSIKDICDANPGLSATNFKYGQVIRIPAPNDKEPMESITDPDENNVLNNASKSASASSADDVKYKTTHIVAKKETIYKISKKYNITQDEFLDANPAYRYKKLPTGVTVNIPFTAAEQQERNRTIEETARKVESFDDAALFQMSRGDVKHFEGITAALLLPFELDDSISSEKKKMIEFYQGILLALNKLKDEGVSVNLKVIDTKGEDNSIAPIMNGKDMKGVDIIFGPKYDKQITEASEYSKKHNIPLVLPINSNAEDVFNNPNIFQINTPQSYFQQEIFDNFRKQFSKPRVIILESTGYNNSTFIKGMKQMMDTEKIPYTTISANTEAQRIADILKTGYQNIFILNTSSSGALKDIIPILQLVERIKNPEINTVLFGYPEYQIYASDHLDEFYEIDTYFYSWFYTNNTLPEAIDFQNDFHKSFSRQMMVSYPNFASYGYDMAYYFLKGMSLYGTDFYKNLNSIDTEPVQMGFKFERVNNWGGFINKKVFFVHLSNDYTIERIEYE